MSKTYIVATDFKDGKYVNKLPSFASATEAINKADELGTGYKVYLKKKVYYQQTCHAFKVNQENGHAFKAGREITNLMYDCTKKGIWRYSNSGCSATIESALSNRNWKSNCATLANWICRLLKITKTGMYFYGKAGSIIQWRNDATKKAVEAKCQVIKLDKTVAYALKHGMLVPGDICLYAKQHTNVYAGDGKWFESGTVYADGSGAEGTVLKKFYGNSVLLDWVISYIIRYNDPAVTEKRAYRVQLGDFTVKKNATSYVDTLKEKGVTASVNKEGKHYIVQVGCYSELSNAVKKANAILKKDVDCLISGV